MSQNGKGSKPRPKNVDQKTWGDNYDRIFKKKEPKNDKRSKGSN
jgi:hypothetical protein